MFYLIKYKYILKIKGSSKTLTLITSSILVEILVVLGPLLLINLVIKVIF